MLETEAAEIRLVKHKCCMHLFARNLPCTPLTPQLRALSTNRPQTSHQPANMKMIKYQGCKQHACRRDIIYWSCSCGRLQYGWMSANQTLLQPHARHTFELIFSHRVGSTDAVRIFLGGPESCRGSKEVTGTIPNIHKS